jgi:hypothetical protein
MQQQDGSARVAQGLTEDCGLTVAQAAEQLGISTDAVRRRLKAGDLVGHRRHTKHGDAWCVHPDEPRGSRNGRATVGATLPTDSREGSATLPQGSAESYTDEDAGPEPSASPGTALMQAEAMATYTRSVLEPLVTALERSEDHARTLERENGRQAAELERAASTIVSLGEENEALRASQAQQASNPGPEVPAPTTDAPVPLLARLRALAPWVVAMLVLVAVVLLLWIGVAR